ncbi:MAG: glutamyl-tRNA synthetase [Oceanospirillaceae bacterium]|jgi:glutamyl-tRNA synthetase
MSKNVRVRFAPSPTGPLHMGGVRTALYNYLFAKKHGGQFLLRVEDTDQKRFVPKAEEYILESLQWCGIIPDEGIGAGGDLGPYRQSERKHLYKEYAGRLIEKDFAYYAFDTSEELTEMRERLTKAKVASPQYNAVSRETMKNSLTLSDDDVKSRIDSGEPYVIRIKMPRKEDVRIHDRIRGWVIFNSSQLDDKVLFKSDGMPTYHLANVVDDHLMGITHVIRGEEWLPSAPLHVLLYRYLGWEDTMPEFAHLPLLLKPDGNGKLSKRDGDRLGFPVFPLDWQDAESGEKSSGYRERGYFPEAFVNMLAFLGWNPGTEQEIFSLDELVEAFTLDRVGKSGAKFNPEKAVWFNQQYLTSYDNIELSKIFKPVLDEKRITISEDYLVGACELIKEKARFVSEFWEVGSYFFQEPKEYDEKVIRKKWNEKASMFFTKLAVELAASEWTAETLEAKFKTVAEGMEINPGSMMQLFRVLLSGKAGGPSLFQMVELLGASSVVSRINSGVENLNASSNE